MAGAEHDTWRRRVRRVATDLDRLLGELQDTVTALDAILVPPSDGQAPATAEVTPA